MFIREFDVSKFPDRCRPKAAGASFAHEWPRIRSNSNPGTGITNYGVPPVLERREYAKEPSQYRNNRARPAAVGIHVPDYNQSLSSFPDAARTWYYVSSPMLTSR